MAGKENCYYCHKKFLRKAGHFVPFQAQDNETVDELRKRKKDTAAWDNIPIHFVCKECYQVCYTKCDVCMKRGTKKEKNSSVCNECIQSRTCDWSTGRRSMRRDQPEPRRPPKKKIKKSNAAALEDEMNDKMVDEKNEEPDKTVEEKNEEPEATVSNSKTRKSVKLAAKKKGGKTTKKKPQRRNVEVSENTETRRIDVEEAANEEVGDVVEESHMNGTDSLSSRSSRSSRANNSSQLAKNFQKKKSRVDDEENLKLAVLKEIVDATYAIQECANSLVHAVQENNGEDLLDLNNLLSFRLRSAGELMGHVQAKQDAADRLQGIIVKETCTKPNGNKK
tara:strand:- start:1996 stop:3003 length:1008 start_codon:yes stop_codon:yes gene_type:complete